LCIRSSIEPAAIRYRRIIAYIYCSSRLSKPPTIELECSNRITAGCPKIVLRRNGGVTGSVLRGGIRHREPSKARTEE
jgi:hypothetical protein